MTTPAFFIDKVLDSAVKDHVDVHVRYAGGLEVFTLPKSYPKMTILSHIKGELKAMQIEKDAQSRLASLVGKYDL